MQNERIDQLLLEACNKRRRLWFQEPDIVEKTKLLRYFDRRIAEEKDPEIAKLWHEARAEHDVNVQGFMNEKIMQDFNQATQEASDDEYFSLYEKLAESYQAKIMSDQIIKLGRPYASLKIFDEVIEPRTTLDETIRNPHTRKNSHIFIARNGLIETSLQLYNRKYESQNIAGFAKLIAEMAF